MSSPETLAIVELLRRKAESASAFYRQMAEAKSLRQDGNTDRRTDLYMWPSPEQTLEDQAADLIEELVAALDGLLECAGRRRPDGHYEFCLVPNRDVEAAKDALAKARGQ